MGKEKDPTIAEKQKVTKLLDDGKLPLCRGCNKYSLSPDDDSDA